MTDLDGRHPTPCADEHAPHAAPEITRASSIEEITHLLELCKAGKLFEVQEWIALGKPLNPPLPAKGKRLRTPLSIAVNCGFHSLVQVLLKAGAAIEPLGYRGVMDRAIELRRLDIVQLLVEHGFDVKSIDMRDVFQSWEPHVMEYFIEQGAEVEEGNPLADALCNRIRTALRVLKRYRDRFPSFQEQANIALRHHCMKGDAKWVSLMLWAGADPYSVGMENPEESRDADDEGLTAIEFAALWQHLHLFDIKKFELRPSHPATRDVLRAACKQGRFDIAERLIAGGMILNDQPNGGCSAMQRLLQEDQTLWSRIGSIFTGRREEKTKLDTEDARDMMRAVHFLASKGAKWLPSDKLAVAEVRKSLLKLTADYTVELAWILAKYNAGTAEDLRELIRTPSMQAHLRDHQSRLREILASFASKNLPA